MQTRSIIFAGAVALLVSSAVTPAFANSATTPMSLGDAVAYALDHSPTIAQKYAGVRTAYYNLGQARLSAYPEAVGSLSNTSEKSENYNAFGILAGVSPASVFSQNTASIGITNYTLNTGGLSFIQLAAAKAQLAQAQQDLATAEDQIANTVTTAYYAVVQKQATVTVDRSDLDYQNHLVSDAQVKEKAGVAAGVDVLRAQVAQAKSNSTLAGAQNDVTNANESLAQAIGAPLGTTFAYSQTIGTPALPEKSLDQLETIGLANRPEVESAKDALAATQLTRKGWDSKLAPVIQMTATFGNQLTPTNFGQEFLNASGQVAAIPHVGSPGFWNLGATSTFALPLSDYGARHFERISDDAAVTNAQVTLEQAKIQVDIDIRQSYRAAQTALVQLGYARDEARLGAESARIAQLQYQHGLIALTDVISAQQQSITAQLDLITAQVTYVDAVVKLRVSLGTYDARNAVADLR